MPNLISRPEIQKLYRPLPTSHKGDNGKLLIIGGSRLFHGASLWAVKTASRIVDLVFYYSIPQNLKIAQKALLFDFIAVPRQQLISYLDEAETILIGPGLTREKTTKILTDDLLEKFPQKRFVIDAGSLQMMNKKLLNQNHLITPHLREFKNLFNPPEEKIQQLENNQIKIDQKAKIIQNYSREHGCVILLKGKTDIITSPTNWKYNTTGNEGMTKGGTGDVLAGLVAALACKNNLFLAACAGAYFNGLAGDELKKKVGIYFNASDLCDELPQVMASFFKKK